MTQAVNVEYKLIGSRIKAERLSLGMTQEVLAEKLEVTIGYVSQVERGITKISLDLLAKVSTILGRDISVFVTGSAVGSDNYMLDGMAARFKQLDSRDRKLVLDIVELMLENK